jgi:hypothetical protein
MYLFNQRKIVRICSIKGKSCVFVQSKENRGMPRGHHDKHCTQGNQAVHEGHFAFCVMPGLDPGTPTDAGICGSVLARPNTTQFGWPGARAQTRLLVQRFPRRILQSANRALNLAGSLFSSALGFGFRITGNFTDDFLDRALGLMSGAFNPVFIHDLLSPGFVAENQGL